MAKYLGFKSLPRMQHISNTINASHSASERFPPNQLSESLSYNVDHVSNIFIKRKMRCRKLWSERRAQNVAARYFSNTNEREQLVALIYSELIFSSRSKRNTKSNISFRKRQHLYIEAKFNIPASAEIRNFFSSFYFSACDRATLQIFGFRDPFLVLLMLRLKTRESQDTKPRWISQNGWSFHLYSKPPVSLTRTLVVGKIYRLSFGFVFLRSRTAQPSRFVPIKTSVSCKVNKVNVRRVLCFVLEKKISNVH